MKRTDITAIWKDATEEQIKAIMDINGADINAAKAGAADLQKQLDAANKSLAEATEKLKSAISTEDLKKITDKSAGLEKELNDLKAANSIRDIRDKVAAEKKVPVKLLSGSTEEECTAQADALLAFAKPGGYPHVQDHGDPGSGGTKATRDIFAEYAKEIL